MQPIITTKLFKNGNSQAIRLPKAFRFEGNEVMMYREGARIIIQPKHADWETFFSCKEPIPDDFMKNRDDALPQEREWF